MNTQFAHLLPVSVLALATTWVFAQEAAPTNQGAPPVRGQGETKGPPPANPPKGNQKPPNVKTSTPGPSAKKPPQTLPGKPPVQKKPWLDFKLNPKTTLLLDYTESNPDAIISLFARTSGITIIKTPQFKTPLTLVSAKPVSLNEAFELFNTVLGLYNYELTKSGKFLMVSMKQPPPQGPMQPPPPPPQPVVKTYPLQNANAAQVAKVIVDVYGPAAPAGGGASQPGMEGVVRFGGPQFGGPQPGMGGAPPGGAAANFKVTSDEYSNSVIVKALPTEQTKIEELIKELDKTTGTPLISEVFKLEFVPADQAVTAIEDLLTANAPTGRGAAKPAQPSYNDFFIFGPTRSQRSAGGQSATAIKQTNSVNVNATKENMEMVRRLIKNLDQPFTFADNTNVIKLLNAKASDIADLLNKVFAQQRNNNSDFGFFIFDPFGDSSNSRNKGPTTDFDEEGRIVNTRDIQGKVRIEADASTNSIVVVTQPSNMRMIRKVIEKLDVAAEQVVIETLIVEASLDRTTKLGVEYNFIGDLFGGFGVGSQGFGIQSGAATNPVRGFQYTLQDDKYKVFLNAIQSDDRFKVLDTPRIFTSNNAKAEINVSQSVPYPRTQNATLGVLTTNVDFLDVGVVLNVTPRITANGFVTMEIVQSADDLVGIQNFGNVSAPLTNKRKASTTATVKDGETIVLGGIIQHVDRKNIQKVPLLGDIPVLGNLFTSRSITKSQTELMVFLTPHVIRNNDDAQRLRQETQKELTKPSQNDLKRIIPPSPRP